MKDADVYAALRNGRRPGDAARVVVWFGLFLCVAWVACCAVWLAQYARDAYIGGLCVTAGGSWDGMSCHAPEYPAQPIIEPEPAAPEWWKDKA